jgi:cytochrome c-type biogenesis protein CcmE
MAQTTWEKSTIPGQAVPTQSGVNMKFILGGVILLAAVGYLIISGTLGGAAYFITVDEVVNNPEYAGQTVRLTGAVIGDTIQYDSGNLVLDFTIAHLPKETPDLAYELYLASNSETATRLPVHMVNEVKPDLLQHEAQAIVTGYLGDDGVFYASELLLKCPSRFESAAPEAQAVLSDET